MPEEFKENGLTRFSGKNLDVVNDFPVEIKAERLFGNTYMRLFVLDKPLDKSSECKHKDCTQKVGKRAMVNIWGSVYEVDVCDDHFVEYNGHLIDDFPWKK